MQILKAPLSLDDLAQMAAATFGNLVKAAVDVEHELLALDAELNSDLEALLVSGGSTSKDLWGISLYPELTGDDFIEFDSMINVRPSAGNRTRGVDDETTRKRIALIVEKWISR